MQTSNLQLKVQNYIIAIILVFIFIPVSASEIFIDSENQEIKKGEQFEISVFLNAEEEYINAIEGQIIFPQELLELKEIRDGNSIVSFWIERPEIEPSNQIVFSGIVPGGYAGNKGLILSAIFQSKIEGSGTIEIDQAKTLLNDGEGTETSIITSNLQIIVLREEPSPQTPLTEIIDTTPPESFEPIIGQDSEIFDGKSFLVFAAQDKGAGIDYYEVLEKGQKGSLQELAEGREEEWRTEESPYLLTDQELKSHVYIKAVDKEGNERITSLLPQNPLKWYENYFVLFAILMIVIITLTVWRRVKKINFGKLSIFGIVLTIASLAFPVFVLAADLYLSPATGSYNVDQIFPIDVYVSSIDQAINAVSGAISFSPDKLEVVSLSKDGSIFNLWVLDPVFSNSAGIITLEGITLNPGFIGSAGKIIRINFKAKESGNSLLTFSSSSVLANDGKGTNVLVGIGSGNYTIQSEIASPPAEDVSSKNAPEAVIISSPTHPDSEKWYSNSNPKFAWEVPEDTIGIKLLVDRRSVATPTVFYSELISEKQLGSLAGGIWYFHAQLQNEFGWGEISHYKFQIAAATSSLLNIEEEDGEIADIQPVLFSGTALTPIEVLKLAIDYLATIITFLVLLLAIIFGTIWSWQKIEEIRKKTGKLTRAEKALYRASDSLRREVEKQVAKLDGRPGLSRKEERIYEKLKRALKKSEKSVSKNIKDIEKKLS